MVTLFLGMGDWIFTKCGEGYWLAGIGRVLAPPLPPRRRSHGALRFGIELCDTKQKSLSAQALL